MTARSSQAKSFPTNLVALHLMNTQSSRSCRRKYHAISRNFSSDATLESLQAQTHGRDNVSLAMDDFDLESGTESKQRTFRKSRAQHQWTDIMFRDKRSSVFNHNDSTKLIEQCMDTQSLKQLYQQVHDDRNKALLSDFRIYHAFLLKAIGFDESYFWEIFASLKEQLLHKQCIIRDKCSAITALYNAAIQCTFQQSKNIHKVLPIWDDLKMLCNDDSNLWPKELAFHPRTLTTVMKACLDARAHNQCRVVIDEVLENELAFKYDTQNQLRLWTTILNYYGKTNNVDAMEVCYLKMTTEYRVKPDSAAFSIRMNAYAKKKDQQKFESIFREYIETFDEYPSCSVFVALLNGYSYNGDVESCIAVLKLLLSKHRAGNEDPRRHSLPTLNWMIFVPIFRSLSTTSATFKMKAEHGWKIVEYLLHEMEQTNVTANEIIYSVIFFLAGNRCFDEPSLEKLSFYYEEMTDKHGLQPQYMQLKNVLLSGVQYFEHMQQQHVQADDDDEEQTKKINQNKHAFVQWWTQQMQKYGIEMTNELKRILIEHSCIAHIPTLN